jgi:hypothetical protein
VYTWPSESSSSGAHWDRRYSGGFRDGKRSGLGVMTYADGRVDAGVWRDGALETPMPVTCGAGGSMTATMRAAAREAERAAVGAGWAVKLLHEELEGVPGPLTASHLISWGGGADHWPWDETQPTMTTSEGDGAGDVNQGDGGGNTYVSSATDRNGSGGGGGEVEGGREGAADATGGGGEGNAATHRSGSGGGGGSGGRSGDANANANANDDATASSGGTSHGDAGGLGHDDNGGGRGTDDDRGGGGGEEGGFHFAGLGNGGAGGGGAGGGLPLDEWKGTAALFAQR